MSETELTAKKIMSRVRIYGDAVLALEDGSGTAEAVEDAEAQVKQGIESALAAQPDPRVKALVEACEGLIQSLDSVSDAETFDSVHAARKALAAAKGEPAEDTEDMDPFGDHVETACRDCGCNPCDCERMAELDAAYHEEYGPDGIDPELLIPPGLGLPEDAR